MPSNQGPASRRSWRRESFSDMSVKSGITKGSQLVRRSLSDSSSHFMAFLYRFSVLSLSSNGSLEWGDRAASLTWIEAWGELLKETGFSGLSEVSTDSSFAGDNLIREMEGRGKELIVVDSVGLSMISFILVFSVESSQKVIGEATLKSIRNKTQRVTGQKATMEKNMQSWPTQSIVCQFCVVQELALSHSWTSCRERQVWGQSELRRSAQPSRRRSYSWGRNQYDGRCSNDSIALIKKILDVRSSSIKDRNVWSKEKHVMERTFIPMSPLIKNILLIAKSGSSVFF